MKTPSDLVTKSKERLQRPPAPSLRDVLVGDRQTPLSDGAMEGARVLGTLSRRYAEDCEAHLAARNARLEAEAEREKVLLAAIDRRRREAIR